MFDIGSSLREAREKRGLSVDDAQKELRIRERYLTALEEESWNLLPGDAYARAFLRSYSEFLGLNGTLYVDEYDARVATHEDEPFVPDSLAAERGVSRILFRTIAGVIAVAAIVAALVAFGSSGPTSASVQVAAAANAPSAAARTLAIGHVRRWTAPRVEQTRTPVALVRAVRGRSWFSVRLGGANGREVFRGFLNPGHKLTYRLNQNVWMRVGRPKVVTIRVGSRLVRGLPGDPANVLLTKRGAKRL